jgi:hypothetical protein
MDTKHHVTAADPHVVLGPLNSLRAESLQLVLGLPEQGRKEYRFRTNGVRRLRSRENRPGSSADKRNPDAHAFIQFCAPLVRLTSARPGNTRRRMEVGAALQGGVAARVKSMTMPRVT